MNEPEFKNYKEKQNYYKELTKNRGNMFFAQPLPAVVNADGMTGTIKPVKGKTYVKESKNGKSNI